MTIGENLVQQLCFTARALAQTHPLSPAVYDYRRAFVKAEGSRQPNKDFVDWSSNCLLVGYCLRRAEENDKGTSVDVAHLNHKALSERANVVAAEISAGVDRHFIGDVSVVIAALDRLISTELEKRWETAKDYASTQDWELVEEYLAWSVLHGYCLRVAETTEGA
jgi:hypothetical protein